MHESNADKSSPIIEFQKVSKSFGSNAVLTEIDLKVPRGKITFIIGRSGEGKSVTLKHIIGLIKPDSGKILFNGEEMQNASVEKWQTIRKKVGTLFQDGAIFDSLSVEENVGFPYRYLTLMKHSEIQTKVDKLLQLVNLSYARLKYPGQLSIGERKRVGLARALALDPELLLYDEPTTAMDPLISDLIDSLIRKMQKDKPGITSIVVSHDLHSVMELADNIIFIHEGRVQAQGTPEEFEKSSNPYVRQFLQGSLEGPM